MYCLYGTTIVLCTIENYLKNLLVISSYFVASSYVIGKEEIVFRLRTLVQRETPNPILIFYFSLDFCFHYKVFYAEFVFYYCTKIDFFKHFFHFLIFHEC